MMGLNDGYLAATLLVHNAQPNETQQGTIQNTL